MVVPHVQDAAAIITRQLPVTQAELLNGIVFGIPLSKASAFYTDVRHVGLLHMVVLSGTNITILAVLFGYITQKINKLYALVLNIMCIVIFICFVGLQAPIVRAGIMGILTSVAVMYGRKSEALYTLIISGVVILLFKTEWITSLSFLLSFGATLGIILFALLFNNRMPRSGYRAALAKELLPSLGAQVCTVPIIFIYFKEISLIAPISNLLIAPCVPIVMVLGFIIVFLGSIHPALAVIPSYLAYGILTVMIWVIEFLAKIPGGFVQFHS